jgi:O-antigen biosynthesis protein WbqP
MSRRSMSEAVMRVLDILFSAVGMVLGSPILLLIGLMGWLDTRSPLLRQQRVGRHQQPFVLVKFRTMRPNTAHVASHLADASAITPLGALLRRTKLDELPQLWNVLKGEMSLVGPRPCLPSQTELIAARERLGVYAVRPGITGMAQVSGIDMSTPELLAQTDAQMIRTLNVPNYLRYLVQTVAGKGGGDAIHRQGGQ